MKILALALALSLIGCVQELPTVLTTAPSADVLRRPLVQGVGSVLYPLTGDVARFNVRIDQDQGVAQGSARFDYQDGSKVDVDVDCLSISYYSTEGGVAWVGGIVSDATDGSLVGTRMEWQMVDAGTDQISQAAPGPNCNQHIIASTYDLISGHVRIGR